MTRGPPLSLVARSDHSRRIAVHQAGDCEPCSHRVATAREDVRSRPSSAHRPGAPPLFGLRRPKGWATRSPSDDHAFPAVPRPGWSARRRSDGSSARQGWRQRTPRPADNGPTDSTSSAATSVDSTARSLSRVAALHGVAPKPQPQLPLTRLAPRESAVLRRPIVYEVPLSQTVAASTAAPAFTAETSSHCSTAPRTG